MGADAFREQLPGNDIAMVLHLSEQDLVAAMHVLRAPGLGDEIDAFGGAAASVDVRKRRRLLRAAEQLLQQRKELARLQVRFDVIVVHQPASKNPRSEWIKHAFT